MKKSYAQALLARGEENGTQFGRASPPSAAPSSRSGVSVEAASEPQSETEEVTVQSAKKSYSAEQVQLKADVKEIGDAIAALPPGALFDNARADLQARFEEAKTKLTRSHPPGAQLDSCVQAIERAQRRRSKAAQTIIELKERLAQATKDVEEEDRNIANFSESKSNIEAAVAASTSSLPSVAAPSAQPPPVDVAALASTLNQLLASQKNAQQPPPEVMAAAESHMVILQAASTAASAAAAASTNASTAALATRAAPEMDVDSAPGGRRMRAKVSAALPASGDLKAGDTDRDL